MARFFAITTAAAIAGSFAAATPARATEWPWCADLYFGSWGTATNCGFVSFAQCEQYISGQSGFCYPNLRYRAEPQPRRRRGG